MSIVYRYRGGFFESVVGYESEQEMGRVVFPSLHSFLAYFVPRDCRSVQALRGLLSLLSVCLLRKNEDKKRRERKSVVGYIRVGLY